MAINNLTKRISVLFIQFCKTHNTIILLEGKMQIYLKLIKNLFKFLHLIIIIHINLPINIPRLPLKINR